MIRAINASEIPRVSQIVSDESKGDEMSFPHLAA